MSIGPITKDENFNTSIVNRIQYSAKRLTESFFIEPIHYLFYGSLTALLIGLFVGMEFSWKFYIIVSSLGLAELATKLWKHYSTHKI